MPFARRSRKKERHRLRPDRVPVPAPDEGGDHLDIAEVVRQLQAEGWKIDPEDLAQVSPYLTEHVRRSGEYSAHELGDEPATYDPRFDVDFTPPRGEEPAAAGYGQAA
ncbi:transposase [Streptomyces sp. NBC_01231]|nr:transposase [Streptomyces sp. NBC_01231]